MSDPLRDEPRTPPAGEPDVDRDAKIEELLLAGLDHYFNAQHEQAIHVWTRVLFVDRGHARARAYIERARSAHAERQRESEELLHSGTAAFDRGDIAEARALITSSVDRGGPQDVALALLERLERLEAASGQVPAPPKRARRADPRGAGRPAFDPRRAPRRRLVPGLIAVAVVGSAMYAIQSWDTLASLMFERSATPVATVAPVEAPLPVPAAAELLLARARGQFERGHLHEALLVLERIDLGDPLKSQADHLRADIQRALLSARGPADAAGAPPAPQRIPPR